MRTSDEIKARLRHGAHELRQAQQVLTNVLHRTQGDFDEVSDRIQTVFDEIQVCNDRADLIDPAIEALNLQIHVLTEDMDRVYALRNNESDQCLREENAKMKREIAALQQALRYEMETHRARLSDAIESREDLVQRIQKLERFNDVLRAKLNEMKEQYECAIIDVVDHMETIKTLQSTRTPAFSVVANTAASSDPTDATSTGLIPFGKTVVETNRGLTVTIESSPNNSPEKASLQHDWIPQLPTGAAVPFPDIVPQPQFTTLTPTNGGSTQAAVRIPRKPKARAIVRGTQEANESFERMKRAMNSSSLADLTDTIGGDSNAIAASSSLPSEFAVPILTSFGEYPVTPGNVKSELNPAAEAFTPSNSSGKVSAKSDSVQASSSPIKKDSKPSVAATTVKEEGFITPHLRRPSKISIMEKPITITEESSVKDDFKFQDTVATNTPNAQKQYTEEAEPRQATPLTPHALPHLRYVTNIKKEDVDPFHVQRSAKGDIKEDTIKGVAVLSRESAPSGMKEHVKTAIAPGAFLRPDLGFQAWLDSQEKTQSNDASANDAASQTTDALIEFSPNESPVAGGKKSVPLPPGFIPIHVNDTSVKTKATGPSQTDGAASPDAARDRIAVRTPTTEDEGAAPVHEVPAQPTSEKEKNAAFIAEYNMRFNSVSQKYGKDSRKGSKVKAEEGDKDKDDFDPIKYEGADPTHYIPSQPTGTRDAGSLLDDETYSMVFMPKSGAPAVRDVGADITRAQWKAVMRKDRKVVYVL